MAITNAQQYQQLVNKPANGKRPGYRGPGGYQSGQSDPSTSASSPMSTGYSGAKSSAGKSYSGPTNRDIAMGAGGKQKQGTVTDTDILKGLTGTDLGGGPDFNTGLEEQRKENKKTVETFTDNKANYSKYTPSYIKFLADLNRQPNRKYFVENVLRAGKIPGVDYASLDDEDFDIEQAYKDYMSDRLSGNIDAMGNPLGGNYYDSSGQLVVTDTRDDGAGQQNLLDDTIEDKEDEEDEINPRDYTGLAPRFMGSIFDFTGLAEGGRVAAQQGGIMPRLNDLSGDVSSAEQMLQEINQRLESAESTLGEGGGGGIGSLPDNFQPAIPAENTQPQATFSGFDQPLFDKDGFRLGDQRYGTGLVGGPQMALPGLTNQSPGGALQSPLAGAIRQGAMDGGRMRQMEMMQDEDDPTGGIMDLESGRQMYFLGKLVKKAGRAIKKVVKSPIGKAALLYFGGNALMGGGGGGLSSLFKSGKGSGFKDFLTRSFLGKEVSGGAAAGRGRTGGILGFMKNNPYLSILGGSTALAGLSGKGEDEDGPINYGLDIDIDAIRANPYKFLPAGIIGSNYQRGTEGRKDGGRMGYQEGGDAEPVAKKTMPLLDMDGQEMDLRAEGGFVPLGRMERADDVPARLSKNEFVFTADAVRNAGDGDIDKGAEVMYNMMKNLESGGEVSEESQGLDGAREMFQTSKRLEEVL